MSDFVTPWAVVHQAPLSMEFSRQEYWGGVPFYSPGDLPDPGIKLRSPDLQADSFHLLIVSFVVPKVLSLIRSHLFTFAFLSNILGGG